MWCRHLGHWWWQLRHQSQSLSQPRHADTPMQCHLDTDIRQVTCPLDIDDVVGVHYQHGVVFLHQLLLRMLRFQTSRVQFYQDVVLQWQVQFGKWTGSVNRLSVQVVCTGSHISYLFMYLAVSWAFLKCCKWNVLVMFWFPNNNKKWSCSQTWDQSHCH